jgi:predicted transposase YbfD/YdcC
MLPKLTPTKMPALLEYFAELPDPRIDRCKDHALSDILAIALLATICGAEHFTEMEAFGCAKEEWLKTFLPLKNGIPAHDTFARVFAALKPQAFHECFLRWVQELRTVTEDEYVGVDGKTLRRAHRRGKGVKPLHLVQAWAVRNRLVLGQLKVDQKSNEMKAVPELLRMLVLKGCIVTVDALNTQKDIAHEIREQEADYVLALKENHPTLCHEVRGVFEAVREAPKTDKTVSRSESVEHQHGRTETRRCWSVAAPEWLTGFTEWRDLRSIVMVEAVRTVATKTSTEQRYYLSSLAPDAARAAAAIRAHWGVENSLHWVLDVAFREDDSRVRTGHAAENLALARKITHNLMQQEKSDKRGVKSKRLRAGWDEKYLLSVLNAKPNAT